MTWSALRHASNPSRVAEIAHMYFVAYDIVIKSIENKFEQRDVHVYLNLQQLLFNAYNGEDFSIELEKVAEHFPQDFDCDIIKTQLQIFRNLSGKKTCL